MSYNVYAGTDYMYDREETIKKIISNRPDWGSVRKEMLKSACSCDIKEGDLLYFSNGALVEFVGLSCDKRMVCIKYHEKVNNIENGTIYQYLMSTISSVFYKVPYFWIDEIPIYEGAVVYGTYNAQKYTVKDGWLIPDSSLYCKTLCNSIEDYSLLTTQPPKKEYWVAFCVDMALDKVDTLENIKEFVKQLGYNPESKIMRYVKVDI